MNQHLNARRYDARSLPADALERLRRRVVAAVQSGTPQLQVARLFGVSRKAVSEWVRAYEDGGEQALRPRRRGRRPGEQLALTEAQQAWVVQTVASGPPDEVGLPHQLWTRRAIAELVDREFGLALGTATIAQYLSRWGLAADPDLLVWLRESSGVRASGPRSGRTDVLGVAWTRPRSPLEPNVLHAMLAMTGRGVLFFLLAREPFDAAALDGLRARLRMQLARDVHLVVCSWPLEHFTLLEHWSGDAHGVTVRGCRDEWMR